MKEFAETFKEATFTHQVTVLTTTVSVIIAPCVTLILKRQERLSSKQFLKEKGDSMRGGEKR